MSLVYSTETGQICPKCGKPVSNCRCKKNKKSKNTGNTVEVKNDGIVRIMRQTKGRKGKGVTLITGLMLDEQELKLLAKDLKQKCGTGGAVKNGIIEIQGDNKDLLKAEIEKKGFKVKISGG